jgi:hypothetical protein
MFTDKLVLNASLIKRARTRLSERGYEVTPAEYIVMLNKTFKEMQIDIYNNTGKITTKKNLLRAMLDCCEE